MFQKKGQISLDYYTVPPATQATISSIHKATVKRATKRVTYFETLSQNELNSGVHVLPPTFKTCLATNQVVTGCVNTVV